MGGWLPRALAPTRRPSQPEPKHSQRGFVSGSEPVAAPYYGQWVPSVMCPLREQPQLQEALRGGSRARSRLRRHDSRHLARLPTHTPRTSSPIHPSLRTSALEVAKQSFN